MIRISIMRLKHGMMNPSAFFANTSMNDKNLNYEIETRRMWRLRKQTAISMNDKNLNYEIETIRSSPSILYSMLYE